jgi:glycosyltransferase involved in cell wall biosynthesis
MRPRIPCYTPLVPSISLVMPAYNEEAAVAATAARCVAALQTCTDDWELVILDDASGDGTYAAMERIRDADPAHVRIARHERNQGIATTFEDLYKMATKDYVFLIPADGEYPPEALKDAVPLLDQADIVICRRVRKNYTAYRQLISAAYRWMTVLLFGVDLYDPGTVKVVKREIYTGIPVICTSVYVEAERMIRAVKRGYHVAKVDIIQGSRTGGVARGARFTTVKAAALDIVRLWWRLTLKRQKA